MDIGDDDSSLHKYYSRSTESNSPSQELRLKLTFFLFTKSITQKMGFTRVLVLEQK